MMLAIQAHALTKAAEIHVKLQEAESTLAELEGLILAAIAQGKYHLQLPLESRYNNHILCERLRALGYTVELSTKRRPYRFHVSWGAAV